MTVRVKHEIFDTTSVSSEMLPSHSFKNSIHFGGGRNPFHIFAFAARRLNSPCLIISPLTFDNQLVDRGVFLPAISTSPKYAASLSATSSRNDCSPRMNFMIDCRLTPVSGSRAFNGKLLSSMARLRGSVIGDRLGM